MMDVWMEDHHPFWDPIVISYNSYTFLTVISELAVFQRVSSIFFLHFPPGDCFVNMDPHPVM